MHVDICHMHSTLHPQGWALHGKVQFERHLDMQRVCEAKSDHVCETNDLDSPHPTSHANYNHIYMKPPMDIDKYLPLKPMFESNPDPHGMLP